MHHYFGTKRDLFLAALGAPVDPREVLAHVGAGGLDGAGERLLRTFLTVWDDEETRLPLLALVRGVLEPGGERLVARRLLRVVLGPVGADLGDRPSPSGGWRWSPRQLIGLVMARYVLRLEPLASADAEALVAAYAPTLQRYLESRSADARRDQVAHCRDACLVFKHQTSSHNGELPCGGRRPAPQFIT